MALWICHTAVLRGMGLRDVPQKRTGGQAPLPASRPGSTPCSPQPSAAPPLGWRTTARPGFALCLCGFTRRGSHPDTEQVRTSSKQKADC